MTICLRLTTTPWAQQRPINGHVRVQSLGFRNWNFMFVNTMPQVKNSTPDSMRSITVKTQTCKTYRTKLLSGYVEKMYMKYKRLQCLECILSSKYLYIATQIFLNLKNTWNRKQSLFQAFQTRMIHLHWFFSLKILEYETLKNAIWLVYCCVQGTNVNTVLNSTSNPRPSHYPLLSALDHTSG